MTTPASIPLIDEKRSVLETLCRKYHVNRLDIFGSAAAGGFDPAESDLDFLVEFDRAEEMNTADQYFGLWEDLKVLFQRDVDLVMTRAMRNPFFIEFVNRNRITLYAA